MEGQNNIKIIYSHENKLTEEQIQNNLCTKCKEENLNVTATYKSNFVGTHKLLCDKHAENFKRKNSQLPTDLASIQKL
jgi:hypothetical protein